MKQRQGWAKGEIYRSHRDVLTTRELLHFFPIYMQIRMFPGRTFALELAGDRGLLV